MPKLSIDPSDSGDEAVGSDGAKNRPCLRIDLMDLPVSILPDPKRTFGPRESRVAAAPGRRDRGEHTASFGIDLLDAILGDLRQVFAIESRSCMRRDIYRAHLRWFGRSSHRLLTDRIVYLYTIRVIKSDRHKGLKRLDR